MPRLCFKHADGHFHIRLAQRYGIGLRVKPALMTFLRVLAWRPHRAVAVAYWYATRRRVRARNRLNEVAAAAPFAYGVMIQTVERTQQVVAAARDVVAGWASPPIFSLIAIASPGDGTVWAARMIRAAQRQCYDRWELLLVGGGPIRSDDSRVRVVPRAKDDPFMDAIGGALSDFIVPLSERVTLAPTALYRFGEALQAAPDVALLYGDEDTLSHGSRSRPWLKPAWNAEMILALDYVSRACAIATLHARDAFADPERGGGSPYALVLAVTRDEAATVRHIPHILAHLAPNGVDDQPERVRAVAARVAAEQATAEAGPFGTVTVRWPMPDPPPAVTILIPTRDKVGLVRACVDSLLVNTRYPNYRVTIIDNGSVEPATLSYFAEIARDPRVAVLPCDMPYNFSAINNAAVAQTGGDFLCFLNNDTEVIDDDWLGEMIRYAVRPGIGAVGAQLLYEDRSIQHAGVVMGLGNAAGHAHRGLPAGDPGYFAQAHAAHFASAVTAACMVVEKRKFLDVGGFDAEHLQIAYNDVDLCLKLGRAGYRNVYAPQARLLHLETRSRGADLSPLHIERYMRELAVLQERWGTAAVVDPMHHPALDRSSETYRLSF